MRTELRYELYFPVLSIHPFFPNIHQNVVQRLCLEALAAVALSPRDQLFNAGDTAEKMYFLHDGVMCYAHTTNTEERRSSHACPQNVTAKDWFVECVLWVPWEHVGHM